MRCPCKSPSTVSRWMTRRTGYGRRQHRMAAMQRGLHHQACARIPQAVELVQKNAETNFEEAHKAASFATVSSLGILLLALAGSALAGLVVARQIARPLAMPCGSPKRCPRGPDADGEVRSRDEVGQLMAAMKGTLEQLSGSCAASRHPHMISTASHEIASGNEDLSSRTEQQASSLEERPARWRN